MTFQVGDVVVCVDASPCRCCGDPIGTAKGGIYRVRTVRRNRDGIIMLNFVGIDVTSLHHTDAQGNAATRYRPITKADEQFTASIRRCKPAHSPAPVA